jgi:hypothetical protein
MAALAMQDVHELLPTSTQAVGHQWPRRALALYLERHTPGELVHSVLNDDQLLERAANASYRHANGFDKLVLASTPQGHMIKLDVWWPEDVRGQEDIHNHRHDFSSHVIAGALLMEHYEIHETGAVMDHLQVEVLGGRRDHLRRLGEWTVEQRFSIQVPAGGTYFLHHDQLHRITAAPGVLTATLAFQDRHARAISDVLRPPGSGKAEDVLKPPLGIAVLTDRLERLLRVLDPPESELPRAEDIGLQGAQRVEGRPARTRDLVPSGKVPVP